MRPLISAAAGSGLGVLSAAVARVRRARPLHPVGAVLPGRLLRAGARAGAASGVAWLDERADDDVVVRLSRGGGLPAWCPDVHGLALRQHVRGRRVDVLLSTTGTRPGARHVLRPQLRLGGGTYTSLLPYRGPRGPVLLAARPDPPRALPADPLALAALLAAEPLHLRLAWADGLAGRWRLFGRLVVGGASGPPSAPLAVDPADAPVRFDPASAPPGLDAYPWVASLRTPAYAAARAAVPAPRDPALPAAARGATP